MKTHIWNRTKAFPDKVNFVDSNNVILGYCLEQSCCENAFWTISDNPGGNNPSHKGDDSFMQEIELDGYCFDPDYFLRKDDEGEESHVAIFRLKDCRFGEPKSPDLYVRLENHHNGYYSHGFTFKGNKIIRESL